MHIFYLIMAVFFVFVALVLAFRRGRNYQQAEEKLQAINHKRNYVFTYAEAFDIVVSLQNNRIGACSPSQKRRAISYEGYFRGVMDAEFHFRPKLK